MSTTRTGPDITIDNSTVNTINSTSGGAIVQYDGPLTPVDYGFMAQVAHANSRAQTASGVPPHANYQAPVPMLGLLTSGTPKGTLLIRNSTLNGINNTTGGVIFKFNNTPRVAYTPNESDREEAQSDAQIDTDEYFNKDLPQTLKGAPDGQLRHPPPTVDVSESSSFLDWRNRRTS